MSVITPKIMVLIGFVVLILGLFMASVMIMNSPEEIAKNEDALRRRAALEGTLNQVNNMTAGLQDVPPEERFHVINQRVREIRDDTEYKENLAAWDRDRMPDEYKRKMGNRRSVFDTRPVPQAPGSNSGTTKRIDGVYYPGDLPTEAPSSGVSTMAVVISGIGGLGVTAVVGALVFALVGGKEPEEVEGEAVPPEPPPFEPPPFDASDDAGTLE